jgi:peptidoglycan/xylan/chitin deacetylase (PgdA/CDA1 family)
MWNLRTCNIVFGILLGLLIALNFHWQVPIAAYIALAILYTLPLAWGSYRIDSQFYIPIICSGPQDKKEVALTFDDGPDYSYTPEILDILDQHQVKAAFFSIGYRISESPELAVDVHRRGHLIGNHSFSHHLWFDLFSSRRMLRDLQQMDQVLSKATGVKPKLFRPPYGVTNPNLKKAIVKGGYTPIGWNIRSMDTVINDADVLLKKVETKLKSGAILLLHDTSPSTTGMLHALITHIKASGYEIVRLDKMLNLPPYA